MSHEQAKSPYDSLIHMANQGFSLQGKRALVTGASRGIGQALAIGLAAAGAELVLLGRDADALAETAQAVEQVRPSNATQILVCDIRHVEQIESAVAAAVRDKPLDVLINNAGLNIRSKATDVTEAEWQTIMDTDLRGAFFVAQQVGKHMIEQSQGSIINISSVGGYTALRTGVVYAAAKAGIIQMTKVLALEWATQGIRVNGIGPWYFETPLTANLLKNETYLAQIVDRTPMRRVGQLAELVGPTVFLASDTASYVTGQTLFVDGGMTIYGF